MPRVVRGGLYLVCLEEVARFNGFEANLSTPTFSGQRVERCFPSAFYQVFCKFSADSFNVCDLVLTIIECDCHLYSLYVLCCLLH